MTEAVSISEIFYLSSISETEGWAHRMADPKAKDLILVVDDDTDFFDVVFKLLRDEGYEVDTAQSGQVALDKSREKIYSLVLIDAEPPNLEDLQLIKRIGGTDPKMRKIIVAGQTTLENVGQILDMGADTVLVKPVDLGKLLEAVRRQLAERDKELKERYVLLESSGENTQQSKTTF